MTRSLSLKIGVSGVRGIVGESLTPQLVTSFAAAFGTYCGRGPIILGTDTRPSREMVTQAAIGGLLSVGCSPVSLGVVPVPTLQLYVQATGARGGICATASHNPLEWNALKFVGPDGVLLRPNQFAELLDLYHQGDHPRVGANEIPDIQSDDSALVRHQEVVRSSVDVDAIRAQKFRVAVDCCNGAGSRAAPEFLRTLGCDVVEVFTQPAAGFSRAPEPIPSNLGELCKQAKTNDVAVGFALDSDGDRLALVNEHGEAPGEDYTVALIARHVLSQSPGPIVVDVSSSRMIDDVAREFECPVFRTSVGEVNVVEKMFECGSKIGGESNGGVIAPSTNPCRDSFVGMAYVLEALARTGKSLHTLCRELPDYSRANIRIPCRARDVAPALRVFRDRFQDEQLDMTDGVKVEWPDRWVHVRGSNTEPILRIKAEAKTDADASTMVEEAREIFEASCANSSKPTLRKRRPNTVDPLHPLRLKPSIAGPQHTLDSVVKEKNLSGFAVEILHHVRKNFTVRFHQAEFIGKVRRLETSAKSKPVTNLFTMDRVGVTQTSKSEVLRKRIEQVQRAGIGLDDPPVENLVKLRRRNLEIEISHNGLDELFGRTQAALELPNPLGP